MNQRIKMNPGSEGANLMTAILFFKPFIVLVPERVMSGL